MARDTAGGLTLEVTGDDAFAVVSARGAAREIAREMGFTTVDQTRIATAVSEIVRNAVQYAGHGYVRFITSRDRRSLTVIVQDDGPGIPDVNLVLAGGVASAGGFGRGVVGSLHLMDEFNLASEPDRGTTVTMVKWLD